MIDTHCHIDDPQYTEGLDAFLAEQRQDGVEAILVPGVDKTSVKEDEPPAAVSSSCFFLHISR